MSTITQTKCACTDCECEVREGHHVAKNDKDYCSEACADGHPSGEGCCENSCHCHG
ncbi:MAG: metallothionein [Verrucomicrobia bacterium]|nr:MAG: metallothionein [Verrucomicrobiota bacterium]